MPKKRDFDLRKLKSDLLTLDDNFAPEQPIRVARLARQVAKSLPDTGTPETVCMLVNRVMYTIETGVNPYTKEPLQCEDFLTGQMPQVYEQLRRMMPLTLRVLSTDSEFKERVKRFYDRTTNPNLTGIYLVPEWFKPAPENRYSNWKKD
jgi:hypothetical protein